MTKLQEAEHKLIETGNEEAAETLEVFETRWRYAVIPAMVAFFILSAFGFYLIYGMLQHMDSMSKDINRMTVLMEKSVPVISSDISEMNDTISISMPSIQSNVNDMSYSAQSLAQSTMRMDRSTYELNRSVSKPIDMMNKMVPFNLNNIRSTPPPPAPYGYGSF